MTFSPKVWGDALRRLQDEIPDFAFDAWIAPLAVKVADGHLVLGCPSSFHRDRVRNHYADVIRDCWHAARSNSGSMGADKSSIEMLCMKDFGVANGLPIELQQAVERERSMQASTTMPMRSVASNTLSTRAGSHHGAAQAAVASGGALQARPSGSSLVPGEDRTTGPAAKPLIVTADETATLNLRAVPVSESRKRAGTTHSNSRSKGHPRRFGSNARSESGRDNENRPSQQELPFSFESFVVGPCNALAREAALALARRRQRSLNQLYLAGDSGMGKTHLARATAAEAKRHGQRPGDMAQALAPSAAREQSSRVVYASAEQFTSEFVSAMRLGNSEDWKRRYRGAIGMLIVEDVQFFSGRAKTQLELFHTVQHVLDAGGSVLLTGDRAPRDLEGLDDRMRDQVGRGFVAELERPDALVRRHILRSKAAAGGVHVPADCLDLLVESSAGSVRDIESLLIQVVTTSSLLGRTIDLDLIQEAIALKSGAGSSLAPKTIATSEIVRIVAAFFGKRPEALAGRSRRRDVLVPRQLAMYLAHRYTEASFTEIGRSLGRDHPSVRNAIKRVERLVLENAPLRYQVEALSERVDETLKRSYSTGD
jgi:chromosomal replication initiator protein